MSDSHGIPSGLAAIVNALPRAAFLFARGPALIYSNANARALGRRSALRTEARSVAEAWCESRDDGSSLLRACAMQASASSEMLAVEIGVPAGTATTHLLVLDRGFWPSSLAPPTWSATRDLTERERQVAILISQGRTNLEIAAEFGVSVSAVKRHVESLMLKTGTHCRAALASSVARQA